MVPTHHHHHRHVCPITTNCVRERRNKWIKANWKGMNCFFFQSKWCPAVVMTVDGCDHQTAHWFMLTGHTHLPFHPLDWSSSLTHSAHWQQQYYPCGNLPSLATRKGACLQPSAPILSGGDDCDVDDHHQRHCCATSNEKWPSLLSLKLR